MTHEVSSLIYTMCVVNVYHECSEYIKCMQLMYVANTYNVCSKRI